MAKRVSVDKWLFTVTLLLVFIGLVMVFSASAVMAKERFGSPYGFLVRQMAWAAAGIVAMVVIMNIDYKKGAPGYSITADGRRVASWHVTFDSVQVGDVTLLNVEGSVSVGEGIPLLGMSFLNRTQMLREGSTLTLTKRY